MWTVDGDGLINYGKGYALAATVDSNDLCDIAEAHNAEVSELNEDLKTAEDAVEALMNRVDQVENGLDFYRSEMSKLLRNDAQLREWNSEAIAENNRLDAEVVELQQRIAELETPARPGMAIQISVTCQNCDEYLNTPAVTVKRANECAVSLGWSCQGKHGWLCPTCMEGIYE